MARTKSRFLPVRCYALEQQSVKKLPRSLSKHNTPRGLALPGERTAARTAVFTGMCINLPCQKKKTRRASSRNRARNPEEIRKKREKNTTHVVARVDVGLGVYEKVDHRAGTCGAVGVQRPIAVLEQK